MKNPFKAVPMRNVFDDCVEAFHSRSTLLFHPDGRRNMGNSIASLFWRGYDGIQIGIWDAASKQTFAYAQWRAGKACREQENTQVLNDVPTRDDPRQPDYNTKVPMAVRYEHIREFGRPVYHHVRLYSHYTKATGLHGEPLFETEGTIAKIVKELNGLAKNGVLSKLHVKRIHNLMSTRQDGIIASDLKFRSC